MNSAVALQVLESSVVVTVAPLYSSSSSPLTLALRP
jgi:hypothetical protein